MKVLPLSGGDLEYKCRYYLLLSFSCFLGFCCDEWPNDAWNRCIAFISFSAKMFRLILPLVHLPANIHTENATNTTTQDHHHLFAATLPRDKIPAMHLQFSMFLSPHGLPNTKPFKGKWLHQRAVKEVNLFPPAVSKNHDIFIAVPIKKCIEKLPG